MDFFEVAKQGSNEDWNHLISKGENPNCLDNFGTTPLSWIFKMENVSLFEFAIGNGADPCFPYQTGGNVFFDILSKNSTLYLDLLNQNSEKWIHSEHIATINRDNNTIFHLATNPNFESLWEILKQNLNSEILKKKNDEGRTIFLESIVEENTSVALELFDLYPFVIQDIDKDWKNFIHLTSERNYFEVIKSFYDQFQKMNREDEFLELRESLDQDGNTPLFLAATADATESIELLLKLGANPFLIGENQESISRLFDREKFSHSFKVWKDFVISKANLGREYPLRDQMIEFIRIQKPFKPEELAKAKLIDLI